MIIKNAKTLLFAAIVFTVVITVISSQLVSAEPVKDAIKGKTIIDTKMKKFIKEDRSKLISLEKAFDNAKSDKFREMIKKEALKHLKIKQIQTIEEQNRSIQYNEVKDVLVDKILAKPKINGENAIPFTRIGYDSESKTLEVRIHKDSANMVKMIVYEKLIRSIIGTEIDVKLSNGGEYWDLATCSNGPLDDCSTLESGIEYEVDDSPGGPCTIGMRATYDGEDGFVTAGHCVDGKTDSTVYQDEDNGSQSIGTVSKETYNLGSSYETCDCAFVEIDSGSVSMDADVYGYSYYPTSAINASVDDYVNIYGKSGKTSGYVTYTCDDITTTNTENISTTLKCVVIVDAAADYGDSGALVGQTLDNIPEFHGIFVARHGSDDLSAFVKHSKFTAHFSGLSWDY
jgi:hypothetical protein